MEFKSRIRATAGKVVYSLPFDTLPTYYLGHWLWIPRTFWKTIYSKYEYYLGHALKCHLKAGYTFWDIGAHFGFFSLFAAKIIGPNGRIFSFEPAPDVFKLLSKTIQKIDSIKAVQCGVGNTDTVATFTAQGDASSGSFIDEVTKINVFYQPNIPIQPVEVNIWKVDTLVEQLDSHPHFIKIDVEGFEVEVLKGAGILLSTSRPILIIEVHPPQIQLSGSSEDILFEILKKHDYRWKVINQNSNGIYTILCRTGFN